MATSQNGYSANDINRTHTKLIPGTTREVRLRKGNTGWLLRHFAAWFDKNIESVDGGILNDWGYAERTIRGSSTTLSNHASGTAIDLNSNEHWLGQRGTFTPRQTRKIRRRLKHYDGVIRWGGDYSGRPDEMHFEIDAGPAACREVVRKLKGKDAKAEETRDRVFRGPVVSLSVAQRQHDARRTRSRAVVRRIQRHLNKQYGAGLAVDGHFGGNTKDAYLQHEQALGIKQPNSRPHRHSLKQLFGAFPVIVK